MPKFTAFPIALALCLGLSAPAQLARAEVASQDEAGFVVRLQADTPASKTEVWKALIAPGKWWSDEHTYSGKAANMYIDAQASGCFCEKLPKPADAPEDQRMGSVEHMHVVYADPQRGVLRMVGGLGPLQGDAVHGVLTITLKPTETGTKIEWEYRVAGAFSAAPAQIAPMVDRVLGEQLARLAALLTPPEAVAAKPD